MNPLYICCIIKTPEREKTGMKKIFLYVVATIISVILPLSLNASDQNKSQSTPASGYKGFSEKELNSIKASKKSDLIMGAGMISLAVDPYSKTGMELLALASKTESPKGMATIYLIGNSLWQNNAEPLNSLKENILTLLKDDNGNALPYYINALLLQESGGNKEALAQIKKGNEFKANGYIKKRCDVALKAAEMAKWKKQQSHSFARLSSQNHTIHIKLRHLCRDLEKEFGQEAQEACMNLGKNLEEASLTCMDRVTSLVIQSDALIDMSAEDGNRSEIMNRYKTEHACGECTEILQESDVPDDVDNKYYEIFLDKGELSAQKYLCDFAIQKQKRN